MPSGVLFVLLAYALFSGGDAIVKALGSGLSVFEIAFFATLFSLLPAIFTKPRTEHWRDLFKMAHPGLVNLRSLSGAIGNLSIIFAFTHVPLAEVYSIAFLAPIFVVIISVTLLKEDVSLSRWLFLAASFIGVLLVVRPGFRELHPGHLAALVAALCGSVTTTVLRTVSSKEKRISLIGVASLYILVLNGALMLPSFRVPTADQFGLLLTIGGLGGTGNILFIAATRRVRASQIAPAQYSQIGWAIALGAAFYGEFPDLVACCGLVFVVVAGMLNVLSDETRIRFFSRLSPGLAGPVTTIETETEEATPSPAPKPGRL